MSESLEVWLPGNAGRGLLKTHFVRADVHSR